MKSFKTQLTASLLLAAVMIFGLQTTTWAAKAAPPAPVATPAPTTPAPAFVIPVEIRDSTADALGTMLVQRTRDSFAADNRFQVTNKEPNRIIVRLYTRGITGKDPQTAYSFTVTFKLAENTEEVFAGSTIGTCNIKEVPADAKGIVDMTWDQTTNYPKMLELLKKK